MPTQWFHGSLVEAKFQIKISMAGSSWRWISFSKSLAKLQNAANPLKIHFILQSKALLWLK
jgi:hypothetical protein